MSVLVVTDTSACLPPALAAEYGITVLDFHAEGDGDDETTAGLGALELTACYARLLERGGDDGVVAIHVSKELSGTWSSASQASAVLDEKVAVIDTRSAGMVIGQAAIAAARCADDGGSLDECRDAAQHVIDHGQLWLFVNRLDTLARGGRLTAGQRLLSTALAIKPILYLSGGRLELAAKTRTRSKAIERMVTLAVDAYRTAAEKLLPEDALLPDEAEASESSEADGSAEVSDTETGTEPGTEADDTTDEASGPDTTESADEVEDAEDSAEPASEDRPRIFNFGGRDKTASADKDDKSDKSDKSEKSDKGERSDSDRHRQKRRAEEKVALSALPRVSMHLAVHHREAEDAAEQLRSNLRAELPECVVISVVDVTHAMAVHTGPGAVAISLVHD